MISSIDSDEIRHFKKFASTWWDEEGPYKSLHELNPVRLQYIRDHLPQDIAPLKILDVGCGGGLLCEPLARLGGHVTGLDATEENIQAAQEHAQARGLVDSPYSLQYEAGRLEDKVNEWKTRFDVVLALEILEHVSEVPFFLEQCAKVVKKDGLIFVSTLNRTVKSYLLGIAAAEYVLGWVPKGTHSWKKFIRPSELSAFADTAGLELLDIQGISYDILSSSWKLSKDVSVNYIGILRKK